MLMDVFFTSKNTGPSWQSDPVHLLYFGTDFEKALEAVDQNFRRYETSFDELNVRYPDIYSVLPQGTDWEMVRFYSGDGWWYSIVKVSLEEQNDQPEMINPIFTDTEARVE
jgi:hypothetical protein